MFSKSKIQADLYGIVGIRQPFNPDYQVIDSDNQGSTSGYFVTDNPFVKVEYLKETQDFDKITDSDFNSHIKNIQESAIASVCNAIFNEGDYIDRQVLYSNTHNRVNVDTIPTGLIAHKIEVSCEKNIAFEISRVLLDFKGTGDITLILLNTSTTTPIEQKTITITQEHQVEVLNWRVDNSGDTYKGDYYFGYQSDNIGSLTPFKRDYESSDIESDITHLDVNKVMFLEHLTSTLPDLTTEESTDLTTGLNPDITVFEDFTDMIMNNKMLFGYAIYLDMCIKIISMYASSSRSNRDQRRSESQVIRMIQELEGQSGENGTVKITGLRPMLTGELHRLTKEIEKLKESYFGGIIMVNTLM